MPSGGRTPSDKAKFSGADEYRPTAPVIPASSFVRIPMRALGLPPILAVVFASALTAAPPDRMVTCGAGSGLNGPVHTHKLISKTLPAFSRINPQISIWSPTAWMVFGPDCSLVEHSNTLGADGAPLAISREKTDAAGRIVAGELVSGGKSTHWRTEYVGGPQGITEIRIYKQGAQDP
jgi:hypothetical protein